LHADESSVRYAEELGGIAMRASCEDRLNHWQRCKIFTAHEMREFHYALPILPLLLQSFGSIPQML
jgi:hypothetical protein